MLSPSARQLAQQYDPAAIRSSYAAARDLLHVAEQQAKDTAKLARRLQTDLRDAGDDNRDVTALADRLAKAEIAARLAAQAQADQARWTEVLREAVAFADRGRRVAQRARIRTA